MLQSLCDFTAMAIIAAQLLINSAALIYKINIQLWLHLPLVLVITSLIIKRYHLAMGSQIADKLVSQSARCKSSTSTFV